MTMPMVRIRTCYTEKMIEVRALSVKMPVKEMNYALHA